MATENGRKMQKALDAVCRMHSEVSKLLIEFDKLAPWPSDSVFGNFATRDLTYNVRASYWMPEGVYRYLHSKTVPGLVEGLCACFVHPELEEPALVLGRICYRDSSGDMRKIVDEWDLWYLYFKWNRDWAIGEPRVCSVPDDGRIKWATLVYTPLYTINSMEEVRALMEEVRSHSEPTSVAPAE